MAFTSPLVRPLLLTALVISLAIGCAPRKEAPSPVPTGPGAIATATPTLTPAPRAAPSPEPTSTPTPTASAAAPTPAPAAIGTPAPTATPPAVPLAPTAAPAPRPATPQEVRIDIVDYAFSPGEVTVAVGAKVTWMMRAAEPHTVTADPPTAQVAFDQVLGTGQTFSHTFTTPGTFQYYCAYHPTMRGSIIVRQ